MKLGIWGTVMDGPFPGAGRVLSHRRLALQKVFCFSPVMAEAASLSLLPVQSRVRASSVGSVAGSTHKLCEGFGSIVQDFCLLYPRGCQGVYIPVKSAVLNLPEPVSCLYCGDSVPSWWG